MHSIHTQEPSLRRLVSLPQRKRTSTKLRSCLQAIRAQGHAVKYRDGHIHVVEDRDYLPTCPRSPHVHQLEIWANTVLNEVRDGGAA